MQCNIDKRGQTVRMTMGIISIGIALLLAALTFALGWSPWLYLAATFALLGGGFAIFESRNKWCALRAMGVRTPV